MGQKYSMKAVSKITGLSPDTIRVWERRYQAVTPLREGSGHRFYSDVELDRLVLLREVSGLGMPIRRMAKLGNDELRKLLAERSVESGAGQAESQVIEKIIKALENFDAGELDRLLGMAVVSYTPQVLAGRVFFPLLSRVGELWFEGRLSVAQEHLISGRLRSLTGVLMHFNPGSREGASACFATLSGEQHEFGILLCCWLASVRGWRSLYLGTDLPEREIAAAAQSAGCSVVALSAIIGADDKNQAESLRHLRELLPPEIELWLGGAAANALFERAGKPDGVHVADLDSFVRRLSHPTELSSHGSARAGLEERGDG